MAAPFDINKASFYSTLEACHSRLLQIQKEDEKRHIMDLDIPHNWIEYVEDELLPVIEKIIYCCLLYTSPSPRDRQKARMPSSA